MVQLLSSQLATKPFESITPHASSLTPRKKMFGFGHHHSQAPPSSGPNQIFKIFCRASEDYVLAVRDGEVVLAPVNPKDDTQHWLKDMRFSTTVKDEEGMPAFALVNKGTGLAVKHSIGQSHPVSLQSN
jgi:hypothetical protein